jgi:FKBP-type peptidyl-prolyl cis-trans isomerase (trigger factor)
MDEISLEELGEMSLNQILDLYDQKVDELDRMTINELREQWKKSMEAQSNMTLNELVEEARDRQAKEGIFNWVSLQYRRLVA